MIYQQRVDIGFFLAGSLSTPMRIRQQAGVDTPSVKEATPVIWMYGGYLFQTTIKV